ncbi:hypothetical protein, partial [Vibrio cholerae]
ERLTAPWPPFRGLILKPPSKKADFYVLKPIYAQKHNKSEFFSLLPLKWFLKTLFKGHTRSKQARFGL